MSCASASLPRATRLTRRARALARARARTRRYPLYLKGKDDRGFENGRSLLASNVQQLLAAVVARSSGAEETLRKARQGGLFDALELLVSLLEAQ